jgi:sec-independent protein translocase protein TatA
MRPPQGFEWLLILFIILLLFGAKRLPDMARGLGRSLRILKAETRGLADDDAAEAQQSAVADRPAEKPLPQAQPPQSAAPQSDTAPRATGDTASA